MRKIVIEIDCGNERCENCGYKKKMLDPVSVCWCDIFQSTLIKTAIEVEKNQWKGDTFRLKECHAAKAELANGVLINKDIAEKLLHEINVHINNFCDDPRMSGRAPEYLYELQSALQTALSTEENG